MMPKRLDTMIDAAVMMQIPRRGEPDFSSVELHDLVHQKRRASTHPEASLRLLHIGPRRVTKRLMLELEDAARSLVTGASGRALAQQLKLQFSAPGSSDEPVWFFYEAGKSFRRLAREDVESTVQTWPTMLRWQASGDHLGEAVVDLPGVLVSFERGAGTDLDDVWADFERSLLVSDSAEAALIDWDDLFNAPAPNPVEASAAWRDALLALRWPTSEAVGRANGSKATNKGQWAKDKRDAGELLGVWSASERTYRHPSFQFDASGLLHPRVRELLAALATRADFAAIADPGGWRRAFWLHGASLALAGADGAARVPAEVFPKDPDAVIRAARKDAEADLHAAW
jgi:hypothetical protein